MVQFETTLALSQKDKQILEQEISKLQGQMSSIFEEIESVGVKTLNLQKELELSNQNPNSEIENTTQQLVE